MTVKPLKKFAKNKLADKIFIRELKVPAQVGILPWEKTTTQIIVLDLQFSIDAKQIAVTDAIEKAVDYTAVCAAITDYLAQHRFNLIETLAESLSQFLIEKFSLVGLRLSITKPQAVADSSGVGVVIER